MLKRFGFLPLAVTGVALLIGGLSALAGAGGSGPSILAQDEECGRTTPTATPEQQIATPSPTGTPEFTATATPAFTATATPTGEEEEDEDNEQDEDNGDCKSPTPTPTLGAVETPTPTEIGRASCRERV